MIIALWSDYGGFTVFRVGFKLVFFCLCLVLRSNFDSPPAELYSWYEGVSNLSYCLGRNVVFESNSSVGVFQTFIVTSPSLLARCDKRMVSLFTNRAVAVQFAQCSSLYC